MNTIRSGIIEQPAMKPVESISGRFDIAALLKLSLARRVDDVRQARECDYGGGNDPCSSS